MTHADTHRNDSSTSGRNSGSRMALRVTIAMGALALGFATPSCEVGPNYQRPALNVPATYKSETQPASQPALGTDWWLLFKDPQLTALEEAATKFNPDLQAAMQRVIQARETARSVKSQFYPLITLDPSMSRTNTDSSRFIGGGRTSSSYKIPFDLSYEIDVWGRIRRGYESSVAAAEATANDYYVTLQTLQADVAVDYFNLRSLDAQSRILEENVGLYRRQLALVQKQKDVGLAGTTDVLQVRTLLEATLALQIDVRRQRNDVEHALAILTGRPPSELSLPDNPLADRPPTIPAGLPSELLLRRPDVAKAEQNLVSASAAIGVAEANFYPRFTLTAAAGLGSVDLGSILSPTSRFTTIGPAVSIPIFEGGKLTSQLAQAKSRYDELLASYRSTVLGALRDVEDALNDVNYYAQEDEAQQRTVASAKELVRLSEIQLKQGGIISQLQLIVADRSLLLNQLAANQVLAQRQISTVLLIKAVGGGWQGVASTTQAHAALTTLPFHSPTAPLTTMPTTLPVFPPPATGPAMLP